MKSRFQKIIFLLKIRESKFFAILHCVWLWPWMLVEEEGLKENFKARPEHECSSINTLEVF